MKRYWLWGLTFVVFFFVGIAPLSIGIHGMLSTKPEARPATAVIVQPPLPEVPREPLEEPEDGLGSVPKSVPNLEEEPSEEPVLARRESPEVIRIYEPSPKEKLSLDKVFTIVGTVNSIAMGWTMVFFHFRHKRKE